MSFVLSVNRGLWRPYAMDSTAFLDLSVKRCQAPLPPKAAAQDDKGVLGRAELLGFGYLNPGGVDFDVSLDFHFNGCADIELHVGTVLQ